jgi:hypothetical protein
MNGYWRDLRLQKIAGRNNSYRMPRGRGLPLGSGVDVTEKRNRLAPRSELCRSTVPVVRWLTSSLQNPPGSLPESYSLASTSSSAATANSTLSSTVCNSNFRPRRKKRRLAQSVTVTSLTTKERIRLLVETNRVITTRNSNNLPRVGNKLLKVAQSRVSWLRHQLYTYWNPTYQYQYQPENGSAIESGESGIPLTVRQFKQGALMDGRWWFWNVAWALTPALLIAVYCETRGKAAMRDFHRSQELVELKKVLQYNAQDSNGTLDEESFAAMATAILDARETTEREPNVYEILLRWLSEMQTTVNILWPKDASARDADTNKPPGENGGMDVAPTTAPTPSVSSGRVDRQAPQLPLPRNESEPEPSVKDLLLRIQQLEATIPAAAPVAPDTDISARQLEHGLQRVKQSGVRNRVEDELLQKWKPYLDSVSVADKAESRDSIETNQSESTSNAIVRMREHLQDATRSLLLWMGQDLVVASKESDGDDAQRESSEQQASNTKGCAVNVSDHPASQNAKQNSPQASEVSPSQEALGNGKSKQSTLRSWWPW